MTDEEDRALGRRQIDQYGTPSPEVLHVVLLNLQTTLNKLEAAVDKGFTELKVQFDAIDKRVSTLERFRERVEERDKALAKAEGNLTVRLPMVALSLTLLSIVTGVVVLIVQSN